MHSSYSKHTAILLNQDNEKWFYCVSSNTDDDAIITRHFREQNLHVFCSALPKAVSTTKGPLAYVTRKRLKWKMY